MQSWDTRCFKWWNIAAPGSHFLWEVLFDKPSPTQSVCHTRTPLKLPPVLACWCDVRRLSSVVCDKLQRSVWQWTLCVLKTFHLRHISPHVQPQWLCTQSVSEWLVLWQISRTCQGASWRAESECLRNSRMSLSLVGLLLCILLVGSDVTNTSKRAERMPNYCLCCQ